jgi:predicted Zn-dependent protease
LGFSFEFLCKLIVPLLSRFIRPRMVKFWNLAFHPYTTVAIMTDQKKTRRQVLEEFVQKMPSDAFSRYGLAMECKSTGDAAAAMLNFDLLLKQHADYVPAYLMYAQLLVRQSRPDEAKQILKAGVAAAEKKGDQHAVSEMEALLADIR